MRSAAGVAIQRVADPAQLDDIRPLWLALHHHHQAVSAFDGFVTDDAASWERRRATYREWMAAGDAIVLVARLDGEAVGYAVAHLQDGPDDSLAVGERWADLYSLSVAPQARRLGVGTRLLDDLDARLQAKDVHDLSVSVMVDNVDARRFYERRGLVAVETVLWRLGRRG